MELEVFWAIATGIALVAAVIAILLASRFQEELQGELDLETNSRSHKDYTLEKDHSALERVVDTQTKRLNDHYSAIAGLRAETRRQRSELRQLTRTTEALSAGVARMAIAVGRLGVGAAPKKGPKK